MRPPLRFQFRRRRALIRRQTSALATWCSRTRSRRSPCGPMAALRIPPVRRHRRRLARRQQPILPCLPWPRTLAAPAWRRQAAPAAAGAVAGAPRERRSALERPDGPKRGPAPAASHPSHKPVQVARAETGADDAATAPASGGGGFSVQLAAPGSEAEAHSALVRLTRSYGAELRGYHLKFRQAKVGSEDGLPRPRRRPVARGGRLAVRKAEGQGRCLLPGAWLIRWAARSFATS